RSLNPSCRKNHLSPSNEPLLRLKPSFEKPHQVSSKAALKLKTLSQVTFAPTNTGFKD
ncbi:hypothetical protein L0F63_005896, partial [Massospora cicadina]